MRDACCAHLSTDIWRIVVYREHWQHYLIIVGLVLGSNWISRTSSDIHAEANGVSGWIFNPETSHYYKLLPDCLGWLSCEATAVSEGGHLVTINDANEQDWLVTTFGGTDLFWIGYTDKDAEGSWVWISGEPTTYTNWAIGEPSNSGGVENYALMNWVSPGLWNDGHEAAVTSGGIIERVDAPIKVYLPIIMRQV